MHKFAPVPQLELYFMGSKICFWRDQNFWVGLIYTKFSVDLKKKKVIAPIWSTFLRVLRLIKKKKKATILKPSQGKGSSDEHAGQFRGAKFLFRRALLLFAPPLPSCGPGLYDYCYINTSNCSSQMFRV